MAERQIARFEPAQHQLVLEVSDSLILAQKQQHFPITKGKTASEADAFLTKRGLVLRALDNYGLPHALRMTIGTEEANRLVADGLRDFMAQK